MWFFSFLVPARKIQKMAVAIDHPVGQFPISPSLKNFFSRSDTSDKLDLEGIAFYAEKVEEELTEVNRFGIGSKTLLLFWHIQILFYKYNYKLHPIPSHPPVEFVCFKSFFGNLNQSEINRKCWKCWKCQEWQKFRKFPKCRKCRKITKNVEKCWKNVEKCPNYRKC